MTARFPFGRFALMTTLLVGAAFFLAPLYVMVVTSLKDADEIRNGNLL
ncbi:MAG: carbohydrate ABC transporter permease, partial [Hydrogenophaga sp.]|nr:carbohydrate ABC transporter permease [Hydrogenophaga sp.]